MLSAANGSTGTTLSRRRWPMARWVPWFASDQLSRYQRAGQAAGGGGSTCRFAASGRGACAGSGASRSSRLPDRRARPRPRKPSRTCWLPGIACSNRKAILTITSECRLQLLKLEPEHEIAVIEMGMSHAGEITELARLAQPNCGVVTMVAPVHLEFFDSIAAIARAKYELIESLPAGRDCRPERRRRVRLAVRTRLPREGRYFRSAQAGGCVGPEHPGPRFPGFGIRRRMERRRGTR